MDLHPGGALWGKGAPSSSGEVLALEQAAVSPFGEFRQGLESQTRQSRRALRIAVPDLRWEFTGTTLSLEFSLTSGSYATAVLRELVHY
jgi:tRNA pseudouridine13 synthase